MADPPRREWLVEEGVGEHRAILLIDGEVEAARVEWPGRIAAGKVEDAVLVSRHAGSPRGTVRLAGGVEALVDALPREASEGSIVRVVVTRAPMAETGRFKRAHVRPTREAPRPAPPLCERLKREGEYARIVRRFPPGAWAEVMGAALDGALEFAGGNLLVSPTPAMTLIDIDGTLPPAPLSLAAVPAIARAVRLFDLAGSIGIDFPSIADKADRRDVDQALAAALAEWPHQSTAMNGFGFVQLVSRLERPSLLHRIRQEPAGAGARLLLRQAEQIDHPGALLLTTHPKVRAATRPEWEAELARRTGRRIVWSEDPSLALAGGFAQALAS